MSGVGSVQHLSSKPLSSLYGRTVISRGRSVAIGVVGLSALFAFGMFVYRGVDMSLFNQMPASVMSVIGIGPEADVASLAYNAIFSTYGALILGGMAIMIGSGCA